jgi:hypothetical protein
MSLKKIFSDLTSSIIVSASDINFSKALVFATLSLACLIRFFACSNLSIFTSFS